MAMRGSVASIKTETATLTPRLPSRASTRGFGILTMHAYLSEIVALRESPPPSIVRNESDLGGGQVRCTGRARGSGSVSADKGVS